MSPLRGTQVAWLACGTCSVLTSVPLPPSLLADSLLKFLSASGSLCRHGGDADSLRSWRTWGLNIQRFPKRLFLMGWRQIFFFFFSLSPSCHSGTRLWWETAGESPHTVHPVQTFCECFHIHAQLPLLLVGQHHVPAAAAVPSHWGHTAPAAPSGWGAAGSIHHNSDTGMQIPLACWP